MNRPATASLRSATPKKNVSCNFDFRAEFFLKKERTFFFGVLPSKYSGSVAGLQCGLGFAKTIFWGKGFGKTSAEFSRPQKGVWGMNAGGFLFRDFWRRLWRKNVKTGKMNLI
jgi:hypothetical protein